MAAKHREAAVGFIGKFDARTSSLSVESEQVRTMKDGGNLDDVKPEPIHDTVVAVDDLADSFVAKLRRDASTARVAATMRSTTRSA